MAKATLREQLDETKEMLDQRMADVGEVIETTQRWHDSEHQEVFRYCDVPVCKLVSTLLYEPETRWYL